VAAPQSQHGARYFHFFVLPSSAPAYEFSIAAVTNDHQFSVPKHTIVLLYSCGNQESKMEYNEGDTISGYNQGPQPCVPDGGVKEETISLPFGFSRSC
jgi:hypothetical protein